MDYNTFATVILIINHTDYIYVKSIENNRRFGEYLAKPCYALIHICAFEHVTEQYQKHLRLSLIDH